MKPLTTTARGSGPAADTERLGSGETAGDAGRAPSYSLPPARSKTAAALPSVPPLLLASLAVVIGAAALVSYYGVLRRGNTGRASVVSQASVFAPIPALTPASPPLPGVLNVRGVWGAAQMVNDTTQIVYQLYFSQNGATITGSASRRVLVRGGKNADAVMTVAGTAAADSATLQETRIEHQSANNGRCLIKSMTITPAGDGQLRARWEKLDAGSCPAR